MSDFENLLELLEAWLGMHRQSILDGTISCKNCWALVLEENTERHEEWHTRLFLGALETRRS